MKVLNTQEMQIKHARREAWREARILKRLSHPTILKGYETIEVGESVAIVTEYVPGKSLRQVLKERLAQGEAFKEEEVAVIAKQLLMALSYCHEQGIMHRDIKPDNVLITPDGNVKLIDFGLADWTTKSARESVGTPYFIAPEMINHSYKESCDVWSLGVLLFYLLTG